MIFLIRFISMVICWLALTGYTMAELFTLEEKYRFVQYLGHVCDDTNQECDEYQQALKRVGIAWSKKDELDGWSKANLDSLLEQPDSSSRVINRLEVGKVFSLFSHQLIDKSSIGVPPVDDLASHLKGYTPESSLVVSDSLADNLAIKTGNNLNDDELQENYQKLFDSMATMPGIDPKVLLAVMSFMSFMSTPEEQPHAYTSGNSTAELPLFSLFHKRFFLLAALHNLQPLPANKLNGDPGFKTMRAPFYFRHPVEQSSWPTSVNSSLTYLQEKEKQNLFHMWPFTRRGYLNEDGNVGRKDPTSREVSLGTEALERFMTNLAEPQTDGKQTYNQDFLFLIDSIAEMEKFTPEKTLMFVEAVWLGVRADKLYVAIYPSDGFFLLYEIPEQEQKAFVASLVGEMRFRSVIEEPVGEFYNLRDILFNRDTTGFNRPYAYPDNKWQSLCNLFCYLCCTRIGCNYKLVNYHDN